jgi:hypothetical protein
VRVYKDGPSKSEMAKVIGAVDTLASDSQRALDEVQGSPENRQAGGQRHERGAFENAVDRPLRREEIY